MLNNEMNFPRFKPLLHGLVIFLFSTVIPDASATPNRPNIILILADDYGWGDVSCNNPEAVFQTPHLDRIAEEGVRFTSYSLLTGRYAWRTELREGVLVAYGKSLIRPGRLTLPALLKNHGYRTGAFGKWHLGLDWEPVEGDPGDWIWGSQVFANTNAAIPIISRRVDHAQPVKVGPRPD